MRTSSVFVGLVVMLSAPAFGHDTEICSQLSGEFGSGNAVFRENHGEDMRLIIEVEDLEPNESFDIFYNGVLIGELDTDGDGAGGITFRQEPEGGDLPLPPEVEALMTGDELRIGPVEGRMGQIGDLNPDCDIDALDIEPFLLALFDRETLRERFPRINPDYSADINQDGSVNALDIEPFLNLLFD